MALPTLSSPSIGTRPVAYAASASGPTAYVVAAAIIERSTSREQITDTVQSSIGDVLCINGSALSQVRPWATVSPLRLNSSAVASSMVARTGHPARGSTRGRGSLQTFWKENPENRESVDDRSAEAPRRSRELARQAISDARAPREADLPGSVFQSLLRLGKRPTLDRADEICRGLGISMTIGVTAPCADAERDDTTDQG